MNFLTAELKPEAYETATVDDVKEHEKFVKKINHLVSEGLIELEEDEDGNVRAYAIDSGSGESGVV